MVTPAPRNLSVYDVETTSAKIAWTGPVEDEDPAVSYEYDLNEQTIVNVGLDTQVTLTNLVKATFYSFRVRTISAVATSDWSVLTFATSPGGPFNPIGLAMTNVTNTTATANWQRNSDGPPATSYDYQIDQQPIQSLPTEFSQMSFQLNLSDLSSSSVHTFAVRSVGYYGVSDWVSVPFTTAGPPGAPSGLVVSQVGSTTATVTWSAGLAATGYRYRVNSGDPQTLGNVTTVNLTDLISGTYQMFEVQTTNAYGNSNWVAIPFTTVQGIPNAPMGANASNVTANSATVTWYPPTSGSLATSFDYSLNDGPWVGLPSGVVVLNLENLTLVTSYNVKIRSRNDVGFSLSWASVNFVTAEGPPNVPSGLSILSVTGTEAVVKWATSTSGPEVLNYEYSLNFGPVMDGGNVRQIVLSSLSPNQTYSFRVRSVGAYGISAWSEISVTTLVVDDPQETKLKWNESGKRYFETGLDRGVLYLTDGEGVAWNGLTALDENLGDESTEPFYMDGEKYLDAMIMGDFSGTLRAIMYPDEFLQFEGYGTINKGIYADDQVSNIFGLSYRTLIGNDVDNEDHGYKIHVVYNLSAYPDSKNHTTYSNSPALTEFGWTIMSVPEPISGHRPTAHAIIDSRYTNRYILKAIEDILYGNGVNQPRIPDMAELIDLVTNFTFIQIIDNGDGTWTARGPDEMVQMIDDTTFVIREANAVYLDEDTYVIDNS